MGDSAGGFVVACFFGAGDFVGVIALGVFAVGASTVVVLVGASSIAAATGLAMVFSNEENIPPLEVSSLVRAGGVLDGVADDESLELSVFFSGGVLAMGSSLVATVEGVVVVAVVDAVVKACNFSMATFLALAIDSFLASASDSCSSFKTR